MTHTHDSQPSAADSSYSPDQRARRGLRAVGVSLVVLAVTAIAQVLVFVASGSVALLADLIHNVGDALTAIPIGLAFWMRSARAERVSGYLVVAAIVVSGVVAAITAIDRLLHQSTPDHLLALALAGVIGVVGNGVAARIRSAAGRDLHSPALVADGNHAKIDAIVSGGVVLTSILVAAGLGIADPIIALLITGMIGHIAWEAWETVNGNHTH